MRNREALLTRILLEVGSSTFKEAYIYLNAKVSLAGLCSPSGVITINPIPDVCNTLIHEILHRLYPRWSETSVRRRTTQLLKQMTHKDLEVLYAEYQKRVTR